MGQIYFQAQHSRMADNEMEQACAKESGLVAFDDDWKDDLASPTVLQEDWTS